MNITGQQNLAKLKYRVSKEAENDKSYAKYVF